MIILEEEGRKKETEKLSPSRPKTKKEKVWSLRRRSESHYGCRKINTKETVEFQGDVVYEREVRY